MNASLLIIDTNVLVAGVISSNSDSPVVKLVDAMLSGEVIYLMSPILLNEYRAVLLRPKLQKLHGLTDSEVDYLLAEVTANALWRDPESTENAPDPGDNHLWDLLRQNDSACLVTGDKLLLNNPPAYGSVISPKSYYALVLRTNL